ncbi:hypothetical protein V6N11_054217 [Hibiscus sabdariffa]|uniref:MATH domain-containing protein n=1 Tax=Hibiscus sabdariffa TaxID=183260 RepID=A0ABR2S375_9ROSI
MSQPVDTAGKICKFRWIIKDFSSIAVKKLYSEDFTVEGNKWRILIYPKGNNVDLLSIYLAVEDSERPSGWIRYAQFGLAVIDRTDRKTSITKVATHVFNAKEVDWGFTSFLSLTELHNPRRGYLTKEADGVMAAIDNQTTMKTEPVVEITTPPPTRSSCPTVAGESEVSTEEDMKTFFSNLESELSSSKTVFFSGRSKGSTG